MKLEAGKVPFSFDVAPLWEVGPNKETPFFKTHPIFEALRGLPAGFSTVGNRGQDQDGCRAWSGFRVTGPNGRSALVAPRTDRWFRAWVPRTRCVNGFQVSKFKPPRRILKRGANSEENAKLFKEEQQAEVGALIAWLVSNLS